MEWLRNSDRKVTAEGRTVALILDNCPAHPDTTGLKSVTLFSKQ